ncbi:30S ribosomal protein S9 [Candidatus Woesebacteria bacterium RIFCSPHIGHO2_01_FULL_38_9]|uniref:30S ribosomal protein S9 n=2 Tax=Candidatus Woeseibacteriota TaxID=1752722 RepID=A0A1F7XZ78_9BACT|nr:MAG: 30S ribosomal protein S9 [Candidatus Woesebacteria bacterium RIFCSPHIGHO2_01_FULL_38_9]OGM58648.1 MAG: 30S ribosomal protein S9 [Candidatus Woesebacteria bacterium RIFCSPLOWO2_01_FULL_39_10]
MAKNSKLNYIYAVGRRRSASARVRLFRGKGQSTVNAKAIEQYFSGEINKDVWSKPLRTVDAQEKFYVTVKVVGGGVMGQLDAVTHGIARALAKVDKEEFRPVLKKAGLLTRDSRIRERRKVGMGGKARRKKQSPKR